MSCTCACTPKGASSASTRIVTTFSVRDGHDPPVSMQATYFVLRRVH